MCEQGAVLDVEDFDGFSALSHAAKRKHVEVCAYLLAKGAKIVELPNSGSYVKFGKSELERLFDEYVQRLALSPTSSVLYAVSRKVNSCILFIRAFNPQTVGI